MARRTATGPNGEKLELIDGKWVPMDVPKGFVGPQDQFTGLSPSLGRTREEQGKAAAQGWRTGIGAFLANTLSLPHAAGELLAAGAAVPALYPGGKSFSEERARQETQLPASALLSLPDPTTEDVLAIPGAFSRSMANVNANRDRAMALWRNPNAQVQPLKSPSLQDTFAEARAAEAQRSADNPIGTTAGQTAGDIATMLTMRPGQRAAELMNLKRLNPRANVSEVKGALDYAARTLARGMGRTAEAGFDGAVMGAIGDGDPVKTAAWSAGIQAGGSMAMAAKNSFFRNPLKTVAALYLGHEMFKAIAPGPQDLFDSKDTAVQEMVAAYGLGTAAALAGSTRGVGAGNIQRITDAMSSASRATIASVVKQLQEAAANKQPQYARVLEVLAQDQQAFGTDARVLLERAANSDKPRALLNQIDQLMQSTRFRKALDDAEAGAESAVSQLGAEANRLGREAQQP